MNGLQPDSIAIHRLRIHGGGVSGAVGLERTSHELRRELDFVSWPKVPGESWVLIRQVRARSPAGRLANELTRATTAEVQSGNADNVVRFASLAELLAALLVDLVRGQAIGRWYWRRWAHLFRLPASAAVEQLLTEHLSRLPSLCARLAKLRRLSEVWLTLDQAAAERLLQAFARRSGFVLPAARSVEREHLKPTQKTPPLLLQSTAPLYQQWQDAVRSLPLSDARLQLALVLIGQQIAPLMLLQAPATLLARLAEAFGVMHTPAAQRPTLPSVVARGTPTAAPAAARAAVSATPAASGPDANDHAAAALHTAVEGVAHPYTPHPKDYAPAASPIAADVSPAALAESTETGAGEAQAGAEPASLRGPHDSAPELAAAGAAQPDDSHPLLRAASPDPDFTRFVTAQGGLLYLLNFLNRPEAQLLLELHWALLPSGWGWLYRLGQTLRLDERDPIVPFIAAQLGLEQPAELQRLPPLPARQELLDLARRWYGGAGLWQPDLLRLNARIHATPSHLDLYAPLAEVRLPVRLAGLDIDPGWLPWLGRVVTIHYD